MTGGACNKRQPRPAGRGKTGFSIGTGLSAVKDSRAIRVFAAWELRPAAALALALRAIEGRAAGLHDSADRSATAGPQAQLALAIVDGETVLEEPKLPV